MPSHSHAVEINPLGKSLQVPVQLPVFQSQYQCHVQDYFEAKRTTSCNISNT